MVFALEYTANGWRCPRGLFNAEPEGDGRGAFRRLEEHRRLSARG